MSLICAIDPQVQFSELKKSVIYLFKKKKITFKVLIRNSMEEKLEFGANRLVHLDLKRAPLKVDFLAKVFPFFREWGATGLLIEWEDTFPYSDNLECIGSLNVESKAYSLGDIEQILKLAENSNLSTIYYETSSTSPLY